MARRVVEVQILDHTYELTQLGATQALKIVGLITKVIGSAAKGGSAVDLDGASLGALLEAVDEQTITTLCQAFGGVSRITTPEGNRPLLQGAVFDDHFSGNFGEMFVWLAECLKLNFADFLDDKRRDQIGAALGLSKSKSPKA